MSSEDDVSDLIQDVFTRLSQLKNLDEISNFDAYLYKVAESVMRDAGRKNTVRKMGFHDPYDAEQHSSEIHSPDRAVEGMETLDQLYSLLLKLPERTRKVLILKRLEDMKYSEIAQRMGISVSAVEKHMMKAIAFMARQQGQL